MTEKIISVIVFFFGKACFQKFNKLLYHTSLGGLVIINYRTSKVSCDKKINNENFL
jgi:hypothetical protein